MGKESAVRAKLSSKGQVTIPIAVRRWLGLQPGDRVEFGRRDGDVVLRPARDGKKKSSLSKYTGILGQFPGGEREILAWLRELRGDVRE